MGTNKIGAPRLPTGKYRLSEVPLKSLLSRPAILKLMEQGEIHIDPFVPENLGTNSYDVTLGPHYWVERNPKAAVSKGEPVTSYATEFLYNPYDEEHVKRLWLKKEAQPWKDLQFNPSAHQLENIDPEDLVILVRPGEALLAHTIEFIGGRGNQVTTMMKARSSIGRNFLETSRCAGSGDVNYHTRWTMEITNNSRYHTIPLVVGRRVAQILFFAVDPITDNDYTKGGKYQVESDLETMKASWRPEDMLPKMYLDREVTDNGTEQNQQAQGDYNR